MAPKNLHEVASVEQFQSLLSEDLNRVSVLNFWAPWAEPCEAFNKVVAGEAEQYPNQLFLNIEAEQLADIAESFDIEAVPSFLILRQQQGHTLLARHSGSDGALLHSLLAQHSGAASISQPAATSSAQPQPAAPTRTREEIKARCIQAMNKHRVVLFMKGNPSAPKCGFSRQIVGLLREQGVEFAWMDILVDPELRENLKWVTDWPTYPQLVMDGELVGGLDVFREMIESGEWDELYNAEPAVSEEKLPEAAGTGAGSADAIKA